MSVIANFCLNWRMVKLSPQTATFPDSFWVPTTKPNQINHVAEIESTIDVYGYYKDT